MEDNTQAFISMLLSQDGKESRDDDDDNGDDGSTNKDLMTDCTDKNAVSEMTCYRNSSLKDDDKNKTVQSMTKIRPKRKSKNPVKLKIPIAEKTLSSELSNSSQQVDQSLSPPRALDSQQTRVKSVLEEILTRQGDHHLDSTTFTENLYKNKDSVITNGGSVRRGVFSVVSFQDGEMLEDPDEFAVDLDSDDNGDDSPSYVGEDGVEYVSIPLNGEDKYSGNGSDIGRKKDNDEPTPCPECGKVLASFAKMKRHVAFIHLKGNLHVCSVCDKKFMFLHPLECHMKLHTGEAILKCSVCDKKYAQQSYLRAHMKTHAGELPFRCTICNKSFSDKSNLTKHVKIHTAERAYDCELCGKSFKEMSALRKHRRIHEGIKPFLCSVCNKGFAQTNHLRTHMRSHTGEKPFICSICEKGFTDSSDLKKHLRVHTGERPFTCTVCHKSFRQSGYLNFHMRTHSGEKPFRCSLCEKSFQSNSNLVRHLRIHSGEKPFECSLCHRAFLKSYSLKRHMTTCKGVKVLKGQKKYHCSVCSESFTKSYSMRRHMERTHFIKALPGIATSSSSSSSSSVTSVSLSSSSSSLPSFPSTRLRSLLTAGNSKTKTGIKQESPDAWLSNYSTRAMDTKAGVESINNAISRAIYKAYAKMSAAASVSAVVKKEIAVTPPVVVKEEISTSDEEQRADGNDLMDSMSVSSNNFNVHELEPFNEGCVDLSTSTVVIKEEILTPEEKEGPVNEGEESVHNITSNDFNISQCGPLNEACDRKSSASNSIVKSKLFFPEVEQEDGKGEMDFISANNLNISKSERFVHLATVSSEGLADEISSLNSHSKMTRKQKVFSDNQSVFPSWDVVAASASKDNNKNKNVSNGKLTGLSPSPDHSNQPVFPARN